MQENQANRAFLLAAVIIGVLAMVVAFVYLKSNDSVDKGPKIRILVAKRDLRPNTPLDPDKDLKVEEIPQRFAVWKDRTCSPEAVSTLKGQRVNRTVLADQPLMLADVAAANGDLVIKGDSRGLSIPVKGANAFSGLLIPGDLVKIIVTRPNVRLRLPNAPAVDPAVAVEPNSNWRSDSIIPEPLKVLAVGTRLARSRQQISAAEQYQTVSESESQQTVTLEVTEAQAKTILEQTGAGQLPVTLILCPPAAALK